MLTDTLTHEWSGKHVKDYKAFKNLHKENLRDNMTDIELALNQLAEISATLIANYFCTQNQLRKVILWLLPKSYPLAPGGVRYYLTQKNIPNLMEL